MAFSCIVPAIETLPVGASLRGVMLIEAVSDWEETPPFVVVFTFACPFVPSKPFHALKVTASEIEPFTFALGLKYT